jgi:hypothetical protein
MRCAQSVPKECQMTTQEHPTPTKTKGRNASKTLTFRPLFDHDKRFLSPERPVPPGVLPSAPTGSGGFGT